MIVNPSPALPQYTLFLTIISYALLLGTCALLWTKRDTLTVTIYAGSLLFALLGGVIGFTGLIAIAILSGLCYLGFRKFTDRNDFYWGMLIKVFIAIIGFIMIFHLCPGFHNLQLLKNVQISKGAVPYSLFLNYDSMSVAIIIMFFYDKIRLKIDKNTLRAIKIGFIYGLVGIVIMGGTALGMQFFNFDFKISRLTILFLFCNLLFTCFFEETFWRGFVQNTIADLVKVNFVAVVITAVIFGVIHIPFGGINFAILATLAGLIYGYAYLHLRRLESSIICHYTVNVAHFIFATYPILATAYKTQI
ncbi:MAG: CPBP family intramembrane metalloprotease [Lentisphaerae bacterium]|nr:CPBP family intramembrane metalloprotease [Lentisphaerota bacterium]MCP4101063.1 CPBP family intramembrane metalloprotease [Lentisphaerota bacterium]